MKATIQNFRGASSAEFPIEKLTLIGGPNAAGKSSVAQAIGAALTGNPLPVRGVAKSSAGCLVRSGTAAGSVEIVSDTGRIVIDWPKGKVATEGQPPSATPFAAGLSSIVALPAKERAEILAQYLRSEPDRQDLESALKGLDLGAKNMDRLWELIESQGWDGAHAQSKEKGARLKGQWEEWTKERYGAKKADTWLPEEWAADLEGASEEDLSARVTDAQDALEAAIAAEAVTGSEIKALEEKAARVDALKEQLKQAEQVREDVAKAMNDAKKALRELPAAVKGSGMPCPKCGTSLSVVDGRLMNAAKPLTDEELKARQDAIAEAKQKAEAAEADFNKVGESVRLKARECDEAEAAAKDLKERQKAAKGAKGGDVDACRNDLAQAQGRLKAWQAKTAADNRHFNIQVNQKIVDALASDGVRLAKLEKAISGFNKQLAALCRSAGWEPVSLDKNLDGHLSGTPYHLLSKSERYRVRVALQLLMATMDGSSAVVIDGADILVDKALRNGLFKALMGLDIPAVVCMALTAPEDLPDLATKKIGQSFWMGAGGVLVDRSEMVAG